MVCWGQHLFVSSLQITRLKIDSNPFAKGFRESIRILPMQRYARPKSFEDALLLWDEKERSKSSLVVHIPPPRPSRLTVLNLLFHCSPLICTSIAFMDRRIVMSQSLNCFPSQSQTMFQIDADLPYISNQFLIFWAVFFVGPNVHSTTEWLAEETERFSLRLLLIYWFIM